MSIPSRFAFFLGMIAYSVASTLFFMALRRRRAVAPDRAAYAALVVAGLSHFLHLCLVSFHTRTCPVGSVQFALSLAALALVGTFLFLGPKHRLDALGVFVGPFALALLVFAEFVGVSKSGFQGSRALLSLHITANLLGLGFVLLAAASSGIFLIEDRRLKAKKLTLDRGRLPPLQQLDAISHRLLLLGFPLLSFGLVSGAAFFQHLVGASWGVVLRSLLGSVSWALVLGVLLARALFSIRGRRAALGTVMGGGAIGLLLLFYLLRPWLEAAL